MTKGMIGARMICATRVKYQTRLVPRGQRPISARTSTGRIRCQGDQRLVSPVTPYLFSETAGGVSSPITSPLLSSAKHNVYHLCACVLAYFQSIFKGASIY